MTARFQLDHPLAISMWDFSWLERRWPGAGYEDWDLALDELRLRGYDAVRIDAYPHLIAADESREWELLPEWSTQDWGSPALNRVQVQPALNQFIAKCRDRNIKVGLSTWFREDRDKHRNLVISPKRHGEIWIAALKSIEKDGLLDAILYVDLCNEWPLDCWAPFFKNEPKQEGKDAQTTLTSLNWMREAIEVVRQAYPQFPYCFSITPSAALDSSTDFSFLDLFEPHLWLAQSSDFYERVDYGYERFSPVGYEKVVQYAARLYQTDPAYWQTKLRHIVREFAEGWKHKDLPLITTEGWSIVDYKDWPLLSWDWVKELTAVGVEEAVATGCWAAIATSNFCGPQFRGMWRDIAWHQRLTTMIHEGILPGCAKREGTPSVRL